MPADKRSQDGAVGQMTPSRDGFQITAGTSALAVMPVALLADADCTVTVETAEGTTLTDVPLARGVPLPLRVIRVTAISDSATVFGLV